MTTMPTTCAVFGCHKISGRHLLEDDGRTPLNFFGVTGLSKPILRKWLKSCKRIDLTVDNCLKMKICSRHFLPSDILGNRLCNARLRNGAVPSRNLPISQMAASYRDTSENLQLKEILTEELLDEDLDDHAEVNIVLLHPIHGVTSLSPPWFFLSSDDITWYYQVATSDKNCPSVTKSVKVFGEVKALEPQLYVGKETITETCRMQLLRGKNLRCEDEFLRLLEEFGNVDAEVDLLKTVVRMLNCITSEMVTEAENQESDALSAERDKIGLRFVLEQIEMQSSNASGRKWSEHVLHWAMVMHYHSPSAYRSMRNSRYLYLPSERTLLRHTFAGFLKPGCNNEHVKCRLRNEICNLPRQDRHFQLLLDEIPSSTETLTQDLSCDQDQTLSNKKVLTFTVQSISGDYRDVAAFYPVKNLTSEVLKQAIIEVIALLHDCGVAVHGITMDNGIVNRGTARLFGVSTTDVVKATVPHPLDEQMTLTFIFDPCHIIKSVRNNWVSNDQEEFHVEGNSVQFSFIRMIWELESNSREKLAKNTTKPSAFAETIRRRSVHHAVNVFSPNTAATLRYYRNIGLPEFRDSEETENFLKSMYKCWCWMNSGDLHKDAQDGDEASKPFRDVHDSRLQEMQDFQMWLRKWNCAENSRCLSTDTCNALLVTLQGIQDMVQKLLRYDGIEMLLTGKLQQGGLEEQLSKSGYVKNSNKQLLECGQLENVGDQDDGDFQHTMI